MEDDIREIKVEEKKDTGINPLDYVTIPVKEYKKLIRKIEHMKAEVTIAQKTAEVTRELEQYRRWWHEAQSNVDKLKMELTEVRVNLDEAKEQIQELLGLQEGR